MFTLNTSANRPAGIKCGWLASSLRPAVCLVFTGLLLQVSPVQAGFPEDGYPDGAIDTVVERSFAQKLEESVEQAASDRLEESLEERVLSLGGYPEGYIESKVEETLEERVLSLGGYPDGYIQTRVEEKVAESVEESVAENVEESIDDSITENIEETLAESVDERLEERAEESIAENIEEDIVDDVEDIVEESVAETLEEDLEEGIEQDLEFEIAQAAETGIESSVENGIDQVLQSIESQMEVDEGRIHKNQWLVMAEPKVFEELAKEGYLFDKVTDLPGIGLRLAEVAAPSSFDITEARQGVLDVVGGGRAKVDLNHIYTAGVTNASEGNGILPRDAISIPADTDDLPLRIGMIDSLVDTSHPSLDASRIQNRSFVSDNSEQPNFHGTAIASILAARAPDYTGLAPNAELYAAAVFERDKTRGEFASTVSLVRALDWLVSSGVDVINISLAGPPNRLLEAALNHAAKRDMLIVAAAGNGGPLAKPMYPAAYDSVIAVTAVDTKGQVFRLANRGTYLDLAAPGVNLQHAKAGGGYTASSGTSFAVPFAATAAARIRLLQPSENARELLNLSAEDIGAPGRDDVYGYGLLQLEQINSPIQVSHSDELPAVYESGS